MPNNVGYFLILDGPGKYDRSRSKLKYHLVVQPIVAGEGTRLLKGISLRDRLQLKLVESKISNSGCVALHYLK